MSADRKLSAPQFLHGTSDALAHGAVIDPSAPHARNYGVSDPGRAYFTTDRDEANSHALHVARMRGGNPVVYHVHPTGEFEPDRPGGAASFSTRHPLAVTGREAVTEGDRRQALIRSLGERMPSAGIEREA